MTALKWDVEYELDRLDPAGSARARPAAGQPSFRRIADASPSRQSARETRSDYEAAHRVKGVRRRRSGPVNPLRWAVLCTAFPAVLLVIYVALWTAAMRSGYHKQRVRDQIAQLKIENNSLQARMRQLQSPRRIHHEAALLGMQPSEQVGYIFVPR